MNKSSITFIHQLTMVVNYNTLTPLHFANIKHFGTLKQILLSASHLQFSAKQSSIGMNGNACKTLGYNYTAGVLLCRMGKTREVNIHQPNNKCKLN